MMSEIKDVGRSGADAPSGSQASPGAAKASPPSVSIPNAVRVYRSTAEMIYGKIAKLAEGKGLNMGPTVARALADGFIDAAEHLEAFDRALRIRIWNHCKTLGMSDDRAYAAIELEISRVIASAIEARRAATAKTGAVEDESAVPEGETPND